MPGGYVDEFDSNGTFIKRVATNGALAAPWGVALAPAGFGSFAGDLLIGNFGNGQTNVFDPISNALLGTVDGPNGAPLVIANLWALDVRTGGTGVNSRAVYFAAGINGQRDGLFGSIQVVPEPSGWLITGSGLMLAAAFGCRGSGRARQR